MHDVTWRLMMSHDVWWRQSVRRHQLQAWHAAMTSPLFCSFLNMFTGTSWRRLYWPSNQITAESSPVCAIHRCKLRCVCPSCSLVCQDQTTGHLFIEKVALSEWINHRVLSQPLVVIGSETWQTICWTNQSSPSVTTPTSSFIFLFSMFTVEEHTALLLVNATQHCAPIGQHKLVTKTDLVT